MCIESCQTYTIYMKQTTSSEDLEHRLITVKDPEYHLMEK